MTLNRTLTRPNLALYMKVYECLFYKNSTYSTYNQQINKTHEC